MSAYNIGDLQSYAASRAQYYGVPTNFFLAQIGAESSWNPGAFNPYVTSSGTPKGIAQFTTGTAQAFGINPYDPYQSLDAAAKYDAQLYQKTGSWMGAAMKYGTTSGAQGAKNIPILQNALTRDQNPLLAGTRDAVVGLNDALTKIPVIGGAISATQKATNMIAGDSLENWIERGVFVALGLIMIAGAIYLFGSQSGANDAIVKAAAVAA